MDKLLSAASGEKIRCVSVPWKGKTIDVMVKDNHTDILDKCHSYKLEEDWESDKGWTNRWGYQTFGIDRYKNKETGEFVSVYQSDYNKFYMIVETSANMHDSINDSVVISLWEGIFWPGPYNRSHSLLREAVGEIAISLVLKDEDMVDIEMYTEKYILKSTIPWEAIQFVFNVILTKLYDCYIPEANTMFPEYDSAFESIVVD